MRHSCSNDIIETGINNIDVYITSPMFMGQPVLAQSGEILSTHVCTDSHWIKHTLYIDYKGAFCDTHGPATISSKRRHID